MIGLANIFFWLSLTALAIIIEMYLPKIDAMVPILILLLQERNYKTMLWLLPIFILLQEGLGTRFFGGSIVWYVLICTLFKIGERFFDTATFMFVFFLSAATGFAYYLLNLLWAPLQNFEVQIQQLIDSSLLQAIFIPVGWLIVKRFRPHEEENQPSNRD